MKRTTLLLALALLPTHARAQESLTAGQAVDRIKKELGVTFPANTVDTIKAGDPSTPVTGIVTTFTPTMNVLRQAVAQRKNLIVTHEPSFYNHLDEATLFTQDPVYLEKMEYIKQHHLVLFRLHDGWHLRQPDGIAEGWIKKAGWAKYQKPGEQMFFTLPPTTLADLARQLQTAFGARILRVVGDPALRITNVAYRPGASGEAKQVRALERDDVEVLVAGEASEWETVEYVRDAMLQNRHKALILLGHDTSEEIGMETCADWLKTIFPTIPVAYIPAGEPYWLPEKPVTPH
jgi:putative NIF3 family GTP cyclohydrolase 1 type 2